MSAEISSVPLLRYYLDKNTYFVQGTETVVVQAFAETPVEAAFGVIRSSFLWIY
jgi:hypothetical protein